MKPMFVKDYPSLFISDIKALVIADLHIGIEYELRKSGINIPQQITRMKKEIEKLIKKTKAKHLIILGDIKHIVPGISYQEEKDIPEFLNKLKNEIKVSICLGNHDTYLKDIAPEDIDIYDSKGFKIKKYGFAHGHAWPAKSLMTCNYLIISHTHPVIQFVDKLGYKIVKPVWIKCKLDKEKIKKRYRIKKTGELNLIIVPAFNKLLGGLPINTKKQDDELLGPLMQNDMIDKGRCEIYLLDGTYIGRLDDM